MKKMQNTRMIIAKRYLIQFDEILKQMADKMLSQESTNSITINFIKCMIPHHQAAIEMSENVLSYTTYQPLQQIAKNIIKMQTIEIEQMKEILKNASRFLNTSKDVNTYMTKYLEITKNMIEKMKNSPRCININLNFVNEMIPHHQGAIHMSENLLKYRIDPRLRIIADSIIKEQSEGIKKLKQVQNYQCGKNT